MNKTASEQVLELIHNMRSTCPAGYEKVLTRLERLTDEMTTEMEVLRMCSAEPSLDFGACGLTRNQRRTFELIRGAGKNGISKETLLARLYGALPGDWPEIKVIDVMVCKIRKKIDGKDLGWIETVWREGFIYHPEPLTQPYMLENGKQVWHRPSTDMFSIRQRRARHAKAA